MANIRKLKARMVETDVGAEQLASKIGCDKSTLYRKLADNGENFTISEANAIYRALDLTPELALSIFFADVVAEVRQTGDAT